MTFRENSTLAEQPGAGLPPKGNANSLLLKEPIPIRLPPSPPSETPVFSQTQVGGAHELQFGLGTSLKGADVERGTGSETDRYTDNHVEERLDLERDHGNRQPPTPISRSSSSVIEQEEPDSALILASDSEYASTVSDVSNSLQEIMAAFRVFDECSAKYARLPSRYPTLKEDAEELSREIRQHEEKHDAEMSELKKEIWALAEQEVIDCVRAQIPSILREEAILQTRQEVDAQICDFMPVTLKEQLEDSKRQLEEIKVSKANSEARINNSFVQISNLYDQLDTVLKPDGSISPLFPSDVKSLLCYDLDSARSLNKDYGLAEADDLRVNFQLFLRHIGTNVDVVIPDIDAMQETH